MTRLDRKRHNVNDEDDSNFHKKAKWKEFGRDEGTRSEMVVDEEKVAQNMERIAARDSRTLFVKFLSDSLPTDIKQVKDLHPDIKSIRSHFNDDDCISHAFLYFSDEHQCVAAMKDLSVKRFNDCKLVVDYVGVKSTANVSKDYAASATKIDPNRLVVKGLVPGVTKTVLKMIFPKAVDTYIPEYSLKKGEQPVGIIRFFDADDAKAAFDAGENFDIAGHKLTLLYFQERAGTVVYEDKRTNRDLRTLFIKFTSKKLPTDAEEIKALHSDIRHVNAPKTGNISFAFIEFSNEDQCVSAKDDLSNTNFNGCKLIVDFVGAKSSRNKNNSEFIFDDAMLAENNARLAAKDLRTLYVKFTSDTLPTDIKQVKALHSDIRNVKTPSVKDGQFTFAFIEFCNEEVCVAAKEDLSVQRFNDSKLIVDFVGAKTSSQVERKMSQLKVNPTRLTVMGLLPGATKATLKLMFPKAISAHVNSSKGSPDGVLQFSSSQDAKAAFDAAKNIDIGGHKLTVLYDTQGKRARMKFDGETEDEPKRKKSKLEHEYVEIEQESDVHSDNDEVVIEEIEKSSALIENDAESGDDENDKDSDDDNDAKSGDYENDADSGDDDNDAESGEDTNETELGDDEKDVESDDENDAVESGDDENDADSGDDENDEESEDNDKGAESGNENDSGDDDNDSGSDGENDADSGDDDNDADSGDDDNDAESEDDDNDAESRDDDNDAESRDDDNDAESGDDDNDADSGDDDNGVESGDDDNDAESEENDDSSDEE